MNSCNIDDCLFLDFGGPHCSFRGAAVHPAAVYPEQRLPTFLRVTSSLHLGDAYSGVLAARIGCGGRAKDIMIFWAVEQSTV